MVCPGITGLANRALYEGECVRKERKGGKEGGEGGGGGKEGGEEGRERE